MMFVMSAPAWLPAWAQTLNSVLVALLTLALRKNHAQWRSRLWLAASVKFLIPFSVLVGIGGKLGWQAPGMASRAGSASFIEDIRQTIVQPAVHRALIAAPSMAVSVLPALLLALWLGGCAAVVLRWGLRWRRVHAAVRGSVRLTEGREYDALRRIQRLTGATRPIHLLRSADRLEPGIFGIFHPVLLWPAGISDRLAEGQLETIMAHELCHVRRRDNLAAALHMSVEAIFWFHPLVWWLGARLVDERENACDEEVLRMGNEPRVYAESILKTCQFYLESPLVCMSGVTGSNLKKRIERIMTQRTGQRLDTWRKLLLAAAGIVAVAGPVVFGVLTAPAVRAQSQPGAKPAFEVASIKQNTSGDHQVRFEINPGGRLTCSNASPKMLITMAYNLKPHQLEGGPAWLDSDRYDITAKGESSGARDEFKVMMQGLLADRFKLTFHRETKQMPVYALVVAKNGFKLHPIETKGEVQSQFRMGRGLLDLQGADMAGFADSLGNLVSRNVLDRTGITGYYNIKMEWTPDESEAPMFRSAGGGKESGAPAPDATGPSVFTAIQEQLGLKLESEKGPVDMLIIDHIEKATEN